MFTPEQLSSPGYVIGQRQRIQGLLEKAQLSALDGLSEDVKSASRLHEVTPAKVEESWQRHTRSALQRLRVDGLEEEEMLKALREESIPSEVYQTVLAVARESEELGLTRTETRQMLSDSLDVEKGSAHLTAALEIRGMNWRSWIRRAARTRGTQLTSWLVSGGITLLGIEHKRWVSRQDRYVRDMHVELDGTTIPSHELFSVAGHSLKYPGDSSAPLELIVNCRCVLTAVLRP